MQRRRDAVLGAAVLLALGGVAVLATRLDRPITAPDGVRAALAAPATDVARRSGLPVMDGPCSGSVRAAPEVTDPDFAQAIVQICPLPGGGAVGFRLDREADVLAAALYPLPGPVLRGGPLGVDQGALLYVQDGQPRFTTSHRRARELSRGTLLGGLLGRAQEPPRLAFGHASWGQGQLEAEIAAGAWTELPPP